MGDTPAPKRSRQSAPPGAFWRQEGRPLMEVRPCSLSRALLPRKHRRQKAEFRFHFGGIGHSIRYLLAEESMPTMTGAKPILVPRMFQKCANCSKGTDLGRLSSFVTV